MLVVRYEGPKGGPGSWWSLAATPCEVAVDPRLATDDTELESAREIALLPPFAGG